jgi:hypothetical protein
VTIKQTAGHVLSTGHATDAEAKSLAASVLGDDTAPRSTRSLAELESLLSKVQGQEGQTERTNAIKAEIARRG